MRKIGLIVRFCCNEPDEPAAERHRGLLMALRIKERFGRKFGEEIRFFRGLMDKPRSVGAIMPTSSITARKMASVINPNSDLPVLELGPGTGVITKAILARGVPAEKIYSIEYSSDFYQHLVEQFPAVNFIHGDAFDLDRTLADLGDQKFDSVISGIPLLNFPMHQRISAAGIAARPHAGRPACCAVLLRTGFPDHCHAGPLSHPAFRLHHAQHPAGADLALSPGLRPLCARLFTG